VGNCGDLALRIEGTGPFDKWTCHLFFFPMSPSASMPTNIYGKLTTHSPNPPSLRVKMRPMQNLSGVRIAKFSEEQRIPVSGLVRRAKQDTMDGMSFAPARPHSGTFNTNRNEGVK
jgi:hypothetical protein